MESFRLFMRFCQFVAHGSFEQLSQLSVHIYSPAQRFRNAREDSESENMTQRSILISSQAWPEHLRGKSTPCSPSKFPFELIHLPVGPGRFP
jgi:hypothetical protein